MFRKILLLLFLLQQNFVFAQKFFIEAKTGISSVKREGDYNAKVTKKSLEIPYDLSIGGGGKNFQLGAEYTSSILPERYIYKDADAMPKVIDELNSKIFGAFLRYSSLNDLNQNSNFIFKVGAGQMVFNKDSKVYETNKVNYTLKGKNSLVYTIETGFAMKLNAGLRLFIGGKIQYCNQIMPLDTDLKYEDTVTKISFVTGLSYNFLKKY